MSTFTPTTDQMTVINFCNDLLDRGWSLHRACIVLLTLRQIHLLRRLSDVEAEVLDALTDEYDSVCFFPHPHPHDGDRFIQIDTDDDEPFVFAQNALTDELIFWCTC